MISTITPIKIVYNDGYPAQICTMCKSHLDTAYQFYHLSIQSDRKLRVKLGATKRLIKQEVEKQETEDQPDDDYEHFDNENFEDGETDDLALPISHLEVEVKAEAGVGPDEEDSDEGSEDDDEEDDSDDEPIANMKKKGRKNRKSKEKEELKCEICSKVFAKPYR
jgi:Zinc-finger associated domain (zf-AD)